MKPLDFEVLNDVNDVYVWDVAVGHIITPFIDKLRNSGYSHISYIIKYFINIVLFLLNLTMFKLDNEIKMVKIFRHLENVKQF